VPGAGTLNIGYFPAAMAVDLNLRVADALRTRVSQNAQKYDRDIQITLTSGTPPGNGGWLRNLCANAFLKTETLGSTTLGVCHLTGLSDESLDIELSAVLRLLSTPIQTHVWESSGSQQHVLDSTMFRVRHTHTKSLWIRLSEKGGHVVAKFLKSVVVIRCSPKCVFGFWSLHQVVAFL